MEKYSFVVLAIIFTILYAICLIIAHKMVKKRNMLAKRYIIGKDSPDTIDILTKVATEVLSGKIVSNKDDFTIEIMQKDNEISKVKVENEKTMVILLKNGEKNVINKAFSEIGATFLVGTILWLCLYVMAYLVSLYCLHLLTS